MARIIGLLISGFAVRAAGAVAAIYVGMTVAHYLANVLSQVNAGLSVLG